MPVSCRSFQRMLIPQPPASSASSMARASGTPGLGQIGASCLRHSVHWAHVHERRSATNSYSDT